MAIRELTTLPDDIPAFGSDELYFNDKSETPDALNKALVWMFSQSHGADIASAVTLNLDAGAGDLCDVTGTTGITAITLTEGRKMWVRFTGALTLTHSASLILPTAANITTAAGDFACFRGYAAGVVRCVVYQRASGAALAGSGGITNSAGNNVIPKSDGTNIVASSFSNASVDTMTGSGSTALILSSTGGAKLQYDTSNEVVVGAADVRLIAGGGSIWWRNPGTGSHSWYPNDDNTRHLGSVSNRWQNFYLGEFQEMTEMTAPAAPGVNKGRLYLEDNGAGKTRLMIRFNTGAAQQIAIEP